MKFLLLKKEKISILSEEFFKTVPLTAIEGKKSP